VFLAATCTCVGIAHAYLIDGVDGFLFSLAVPEDTVYAPGYSDAGFRKVRIGMTREQVYALIGPPQRSWPVENADGTADSGARWSHSPGDTNFRCRVVLFASDRVSDKHAEFYLD
jgi:hypothetical protein